MKKLTLSLVTLVALAGCAGQNAGVRTAQRVDADASKCALVTTVLAQPGPAAELAALRSTNPDASVPVVVWVRHAEEGWLARYFDGEPACAGQGFRVMAASSGEALMVYLEPEGPGFRFAAQRATAEELAPEGHAQGRLTPVAGGWAAAMD